MTVEQFKNTYGNFAANLSGNLHMHVHITAYIPVHKHPYLQVQIHNMYTCKCTHIKNPRDYFVTTNLPSAPKIRGLLASRRMQWTFCTGRKSRRHQHTQVAIWCQYISLASEMCSAFILSTRHNLYIILPCLKKKQLCYQTSTSIESDK